MNIAHMVVTEMELWDLSLVKQYREEKGWTQEDLAKAAETRIATISNWESKPIQSLDSKLVNRVARVLGVSPWKIMRFTDIPDPDEIPE